MPRKIIDTSQKLHFSKKVFHTTVAVIVWSIILGLLARLITAVVWYFLALTVLRNLSVPSNFIDLVVLVKYLAIFAVGIFAANYAWAKYNYLRYARLNRRRFVRYGLQNKRLSSLANLSVYKIRQMQNGSNILFIANHKVKAKQYNVTN